MSVGTQAAIGAAVGFTAFAALLLAIGLVVWFARRAPEVAIAEEPSQPVAQSDTPSNATEVPRQTGGAATPTRRAPVTSANDEPIKLEDVLHSGIGEIEFLDVVFSERFNLIAKRMQSSFARYSDWHRNYLIDNLGKQPLPYHNNFGITPQEYQEFLAESQHPQLRATGVRWECEFSVENNRLKLNPTFDRSKVQNNQQQNYIYLAIQSLSIDLNGYESMAGGFKFPVAKRVTRQDMGLLGNCSGYSWAYKKGDPRYQVELTSSGIELYYQHDLKKVILRHQLRQGTAIQVSHGYEYVVQFDPKYIQ